MRLVTIRLPGHGIDHIDTQIDKIKDILFNMNLPCINANRTKKVYFIAIYSYLGQENI